jgi:glycopeptide antibiotics resistance protein
MAEALQCPDAIVRVRPGNGNGAQAVTILSGKIRQEAIPVVHTYPSAIVIIPLFFGFMTVFPLLAMARVVRFSFLGFSATVAFFLYTLGVIHVTMFPIRIVPESMRSDSLVSSSLNLTPLANANPTSFALNVIMMIPFGFLLPLVARKTASLRNIAIAGFVTSAAIEGMQLLMLVTLGNRRFIEVDDLIANTGGAIIGYTALVATVGVATAIVREIGSVPQRARFEPASRQP